MSEKTIVLVTGGNTGIGYETVKALYASSEPHIVLMGSRSMEKANDAIKQLLSEVSESKSEVSESKSEVVPIQIDIEDDASIERLNKDIESKYGRLDVLVNNAGGTHDAVMQGNPTAANIREAFDHTYSLNVTSTQVLTHTLIPLVLKSSQPRILFVTSGLSSLENCSGMKYPNLKPVAKGWPKPPIPSHIAYRSSKTGLNMVMLEWERFLKEDGVKVFCISPGFLATNLGGMGADKLREMGAGHPSLGGALIKDVAEGRRDDDAGKVVSAEGVQAW